MVKYRITTPVPDYSGTIAGVDFVKGVAEVEALPPLNPLAPGVEVDREARAARDRIGQDPAYRAMAYFRAQNYGVELLDESVEVAKPEPVRKLPDDAPTKSASKADWVAYAVTQGVDLAEADAATRDQLVERFTIIEEQS